MKSNILVIDDEYTMRETIKMLLGSEYCLYEATNEFEALKIMESRQVHIILLDIHLGESSGMYLLPKIKKLKSNAMIIMVTVEKDAKIIIDCMKSGAFDYVIKPFDSEELLSAVKRAQSEIELKTPENFLPMHEEEPADEYQMVVNSPVMKNLYKKLKQSAEVESNILITGETGTGKELAARMLHRIGLRSKKPLYPVNCAAIPVNLIESELFGYEAGAFTGAKTLKKGVFEAADKGTIFMDEISELSIEAQAKLLRVLQSKDFARLGGAKIIKTDVVVYSSSNRNLEQMVKERKFRDDLYYRLNIIKIEIPPLRERKDDIPLLVEHFIKKYCKKTGKPSKEIGPGLIEYLQNNFSWSGNVRELENFIFKMLVFTRGNKIEIEDIMKPEVENVRIEEITPYIERKVNSIPLVKNAIESARKNIFREISRLFYKKILERLKLQFHGNVMDIAENSKIERRYLYRIMNQSGIKPENLKN